MYRGYFILLIVSLIHLSALAQEKKIPLIDALEGIRRQYPITFTYADENIKGISIKPIPQNLSIEESIDYLERSTGLIFDILNERFISIRNAVTTERKICGHLIDSETDEPILGATIQYGNKVAVSNQRGYFEIPGSNTTSPITFSFVGYSRKNIEASQLRGGRCKTIKLEVQPVTLKEVIISNYLTNGIGMKTDGSIIVTSKNLGILPGLVESDILKTIQALPGIQSINETVSDINVRGGTNDQNLVLWEGIKMYQTGHFFGLISAFNPYLTDNVTLIKNGTSAFLGDGISSTIDMRSDDRLTKRVSGGAGINLLNADLYTTIPLSDKITAQLSARRSFADVVKTPTYSAYFDRAFRDTDVFEDITGGNDNRLASNEDFNFFDISARLLFDVTKKDKFRFNLLNTSNDIAYEENASTSAGEITRTSGLEQRSLASSISYRRLWSNDVETNAEVFVSKYQLDAVNFDVFNDQRLIQENEVLDTGLKFDGRFSLNDRFSLHSGYQFFEIGVTNLEDINAPRFRRLIKKVIRSHAAFGEVSYGSKSGSTNARLGLRGNYFSKFDKFIFEPRLAFSQQFLKYFTWEVLGEFKNQTATQTIDLQNDFLGIEKRRWVLSDNDSIPIVQSKQISIGVNFHKNDLLISLDGYIKNVEGITTASQGFQNQFQFIPSTGNYEVVGIDLLINQQIDRFRLWMSYSATENTYDFPELMPPSFPNNLDIRHTVSFGTSYQSDRFQASIGFNWNSGRPFTPALGITNDEIGFHSPNSDHLRDYLRLDISAKYNFQLNPKVKAQIGASVWNALDRENIFNQYYQVGDNGLQPITQNALGLTPNLTFRVSF